MSKSAKNWLIGGLFAVILLISAFIGGFFTGRNYYLTDEMKTAKFIFDMYHDYYYYEQGDLPHELVDSLMDRYSEYYTKEEYELITKASQGYRKALGVSFYSAPELAIANVSFNSPAERAGIKKDGIITKVNGESVTTYKEFEQKAKNVFSLSIDYGQGEVLYENLQLEEYRETYVKFYDSQTQYYFSGENISLNSKDCSLVNGQTIPSDTLYVRLTSFNGVGSGSSGWENDINSCVGQFNVAMQHFKNNNKTKLILDLRKNGGGYISILREISSYLISSNATSTPLIFYSKDKNDKRENTYSKPSKKHLYNFEQITVLADGNTASASESLIGALLDYDSDNIVKVVLQKKDNIYATYGKGIIQDTFKNLISGEALKITVAENFWPISDICIHGKGISKAISIYSDKIYESKDSFGEIDALNYAINFLNN